jgi:Cys-rich repeat protein
MSIASDRSVLGHDWSCRGPLSMTHARLKGHGRRGAIRSGGMSMHGVAAVLSVWLVGCGGGGGGAISGGSSDSSDTDTTGTASGSGTSTGVDDTGTSSTGLPSTDSSSTGGGSSSGSTGGGSSSGSTVGESSSSSTVGESSSSSTVGESSSGSTVGESSSGSTGDESSSGSTGDWTSGGESSSSSESSGDGPSMLGDPCVDPGECASNACYVVGPLGGVCSECDEDADCAMGCSPGNPLSGTGALCCDGSVGCGCETGLACRAGLFCVELLDIPGILTTSACSECMADGDCGAGMLCSPTYELEALLGRFVCVAPGSKGLDEGCTDDAQCASGECVPADIMGIPFISVCSECDNNVDCAAGVCVLPQVVVNGDFLEVASGMCM